MQHYGEYPPEWADGSIQREIYALAGWRCEHCGIQFVPGTTLAAYTKRRNGMPMILTVHHLDGNKANCTYTNLLACCQACHLHIQAVWQPGGVIPPTWDGVPEWITRRNLPYRVIGFQLSLI